MTNFIKKYNIKFILIDHISILDTIRINLNVIYSILKVELFYYRDVAEIYRAIINIIMIMFGIMYYSELSGISFISFILMFTLLNLDILLILISPVPTHIELQDKNKLYIDTSLNDDETDINYNGMFKNIKIFSIKQPIYLDPNLMVKLINDYLEKKDKLPEYKKRFLQKNIEIDLV